MILIKAILLTHFLFITNLELNEKNGLKYLPYVGINFDAPWCAALLNYTLLKSGNTGTFSPLARSFIKFGTPIKNYSEAKKGDIVVLKRGIYKWQGHVGIFYGFTLDMEYVILLGGDQTNMVSFKRFKYKDILAIRRLK